MEALERNFRLLIETMNEGLGVRDVDGKILYVNRRLCDMLGYSRDELVGSPVEELVAPEERERFRHKLRERKDGQGEVYALTMLARDGARVETLQSGRPLLDEDGRLMGSFAVITDVTILKQAEKRLRLTQFTVDRAVDATLWLDANGHLTYVNDALCKLMGYSRDELLGRSIYEISPDFTEAEWNESWSRLRRDGSLRLEDFLMHRDGTRIPVEVTVNYLEYEGQEILISVARDISERKRTEKELFHNAFHDSLTNLPNRALFMDRLQHCIERCRRSGDPFAVLFLDVDRFKLVNDSLGHLAGDALLIQIAERLRHSLRSPDTVARVGGDEFLVLLEDTGRDEAVAVAERLLAAFRESFHLGDQEVFSTASIGLGLWDGRYRSADEIVRDADVAMYRAKARGGAEYAVFDREMHRVAVSRLELETDLRRALQEEQFELRYQPVVDGASHRPKWFEALVRWKHPRRGLVLPGEFLPAVEETDLIFPLSWWIFEEACRRIRELRRRAEGVTPSLSINVSGRLVDHPDFVARMQRLVESHDLTPGDLCLEITESVILDHARSARAVVEDLQEMGFGVLIDDFGAGHSSLHYLAELPVSTVKIDRSFVSRIVEEDKSREIVRSVISLVHRLGMRTVAEGVETPEQLHLLRSLECDFFQGFLFSRPMTLEDTVHYLDRLEDQPPAQTRKENVS